jgi:riboflavin kinase / FMN adenylyltransferase
MIGRVIEGRRLGQTLGFPTANLRPGRRVLPVKGVFAVLVRGIDEHPWPAWPTWARARRWTARSRSSRRTCSISGDLYGRRIKVEFVARLRDEERFDDMQSLTAQMHRDAELARRMLADAGY